MFSGGIERGLCEPEYLCIHVLKVWKRPLSPVWVCLSTKTWFTWHCFWLSSELFKTSSTCARARPRVFYRLHMKRSRFSLITPTLSPVLVRLWGLQDAVWEAPAAVHAGKWPKIISGANLGNKTVVGGVSHRNCVTALSDQNVRKCEQRAQNTQRWRHTSSQMELTSRPCWETPRLGQDT